MRAQALTENEIDNPIQKGGKVVSMVINISNSQATPFKKDGFQANGYLVEPSGDDSFAANTFIISRTKPL